MALARHCIHVTASFTARVRVGRMGSRPRTYDRVLQRQRRVLHLHHRVGQPAMAPASTGLMGSKDGTDGVKPHGAILVMQTGQLGRRSFDENGPGDTLAWRRGRRSFDENGPGDTLAWRGVALKPHTPTPCCSYLQAKACTRQLVINAGGRDLPWCSYLQAKACARQLVRQHAGGRVRRVLPSTCYQTMPVPRPPQGTKRSL